MFYRLLSMDLHAQNLYKIGSNLQTHAYILFDEFAAVFQILEFLIWRWLNVISWPPT